MSGDTEAIEEKVVPETLNLRANPRPVTRINRRVLIILSATGLLLIFAATFYALKPSSYSVVADKELYNIKHKQTPEELVSLPDSYRDYTPPVLGAPLPGELGAAVLEAEQRAGLEPVVDPISSGLPFQTDYVTDMERAERIRIAQRAQQGRESSVFFQLSQREADGNTVSILPETIDVSDIVEDPVSPPQNNNDQNGQSRKNDFLTNSPDASIYNPYQLQVPVSPYQVMAGTVIAASFITGLNSDLPGQVVIAQVTQPVYDTVTGNHLLIPQGARLMGSYDSVVAFGQQRALVVWQRLIFPDGSSIVIDNLSATDRAGYAGLEDQVDFHTWRLIKGIGLSTLFSIGSELAFDGDGDLVRAIQQGSQDSINRAGQRIVERNINIQPTITIRPGYPLRVIVHKDIILTAYGDIK